MANILRKVLSFGNVQEPPAPVILEDEDTLVDVQEPEDEEMEVLPDFAQAGITDHTMILKELIKGSPAASLYLGREASLFILPKRLLLYHSPVAAYFLSSTLFHTLALPRVDPDAFFHIERWMRQDKIDVLSQFTHAAVLTDIQYACTLLCRMHTAATYLDIVPIQPLILEHLKMAFAIARDAGMRTPVVAGSVMEVWQFGGEDYALWKLLGEELCVAFSGKPRPVFADYEDCFEAIGSLQVAVSKAMADRILLGSECKVEKV